MQRYYFHLHQGGTRLADEEGQLLRDADEAWEAAQATARALMARDPEQQRLWLTSSFEVTDQAGEILLEFPFIEAIELKGELN